MYRAKTLVIKATMGSFKAIKIGMCFSGAYGKETSHAVHANSVLNATRPIFRSLPPDHSMILNVNDGSLAQE